MHLILIYLFVIIIFDYYSHFLLYLLYFYGLLLVLVYLFVAQFCLLLIIY